MNPLPHVRDLHNIRPDVQRTRRIDPTTYVPDLSPNVYGDGAYVPPLASHVAFPSGPLIPFAALSAAVPTPPPDPWHASPAPP